MEIKNMANCCLFFTTNRLSRIMSKIAESSFSLIGLTPTEAIALMFLYEKKELSSSELGKLLYLKPSTVTRFVDKLILKKYCIRTFVGKNSFISLTDEGNKIQKKIHQCWDNVCIQYSKIIGFEEGQNLSLHLTKISDMLNKFE